MSDQFTIRALTTGDWHVLKDIRLLALKQHEAVYGTTFVKESAQSDQYWIDILASDKGVIFGMFDGDQLIGINSVFTDYNDPSGKTARLAMWYMRDEYKGRKLFPRLVQASMDWIAAQDRFDRVHVNHRGGNDASKANILKAGFTHIGTEDWTWPDGQVADYCMYEMRLR